MLAGSLKVVKIGSVICCHDLDATVFLAEGIIAGPICFQEAKVS